MEEIPFKVGDLSDEAIFALLEVLLQILQDRNGSKVKENDHSDRSSTVTDGAYDCSFVGFHK